MTCVFRYQRAPQRWLATHVIDRRLLGSCNCGGGPAFFRQMCFQVWVKRVDENLAFQCVGNVSALVPYFIGE